MTDKPVQVLIAQSLSEAQVERIRACDGRVRVIEGAAQIVQEEPGALRPGQKAAPDRAGGATLDELLREAEVVLGARRIPVNMASRAPGLRWVQLPMAGIEWFRTTDLWTNEGIAITTAAGVSSPAVAEWVLTAMLALAKDAPRLLQSKQQHEWTRFNLGQLRGKTLAVIGYGAIGQEVARLGAAFGMEVISVKRQVRPEERLPPWVLPLERLHYVLPQCDYLVLTVPATDGTKGLIGEGELRLLRPSARLVNIARGDVVDEAALIAALREGRLAGAGLDVFQEEPLPKDSPLWDLPNVFMSSHIAGLFEEYDDRLVDLFAENLRRHLDGAPLKNLVDRAAGY